MENQINIKGGYVINARNQFQANPGVLFNAP